MVRCHVPGPPLIKRFAPFYNRVEDADRESADSIRVLVSTDVLSEGVNLQDASLVANYDLHWNPVRLMQRIGRVDRRRDAEIEKRLCGAYSVKAADRAAVQVRNFLPTASVDKLLGLYKRAGKRARLISKTLGIPGGRLFTEDDMLDDTKVFANYVEDRDGVTSPIEELRLEFQNLLADNPGLKEKLDRMPARVGTARAASSAETAGIFVCRRRPSFTQDAEDEAKKWVSEPADPEWALETADGTVLKGLGRLSEIADAIRCNPEDTAAAITDRGATARRIERLDEELDDAFIKEKDLPTNVAESGSLVCWMELT